MRRPSSLSVSGCVSQRVRTAIVNAPSELQLGDSWEKAGMQLGGSWEEAGMQLGGSWEEAVRRLGGGWEEAGRSEI